MQLTNYTETLTQIKKRIHQSRYQMLRSVNKELIKLYWDIGKIIVKKQKIEGWGKSVVERLARDLQTEFPGVQGFSALNVWRMKQFHETYAGNEKLSQLMTEIGWGHYYDYAKSQKQ